MDSPGAPPQKSGWFKWVVIGCLGVLFVGLLACGGCFFLARQAAKGMAEWAEKYAKEWENLGDGYIKGNKHVRTHLGTISKIEMNADHFQGGETKQDEAVIPFKVTGDKGEGSVHISFRMEGIHPKITGGTLFLGDRKIDLETGQEVPTGGAPTDSNP